MHQNLHFYYLNRLSANPEWNGTVLTKYKNLTVPQELRYMRDILPRIMQAGWHLSYMGGTDRVIQKMTSNVDPDLLIPKSEGKIIEREHVKKFVEEGRWVYNLDKGTDTMVMPCNIEDIKLPYMKEFIKKYPHFVKNDE